MTTEQRGRLGRVHAAERDRRSLAAALGSARPPRATTDGFVRVEVLVAGLNAIALAPTVTPSAPSASLPPPSSW